MMPLVSVLIPAYKAEKYIVSSIRSVLEQSYTNVEVIVVVDNIVDPTFEEALSVEDPRLIVLQKENGGAGSARNLAFTKSKGEYIKFFDADDLITRDLIKKQVARLNGSVDCIASAEWGRFYNNDLSTFRLNPEPVWRDMQPLEWIIQSLTKGPNMMQPGIFLIPRPVIQKAGLWNEALSKGPCDDFEYMVRTFLQASAICFVEGEQLQYRSGLSTSLSGKKTSIAAEAFYLTYELAYGYILAKERSDRTQRLAANAFQQLAYNLFPVFPELVSKAEERVKFFGGGDYTLQGGRLLKLLARVVGWKNAKRIQLSMHSI